ncbi:MAG: hypothetical protein KAJ76_03145 [Candidatus Heimdallarchaeota archaeon]|nr:hypothetical protein [Candidatus Heimdallarchaeota archaeon]MCK5297876.1 hypothetical protein [Candidatus Heimdallarchaeota archaeon]
MGSQASNVQEYIEVEYIWEGFFPHPIVAEMQVQLFEVAFAKALELGIKFTLRPEENIDAVLASGDYDIVNYYRPRMPGDNFELILFTLEDMFVDGLIHHRCAQLERKIIKLQRIYESYSVAVGEKKDQLEQKFLDEFNKIEKILYEKQLVFDYCFFPPPEAPVIFVDKMSVINSAKGNVFSNNHLRLEIAKVFDRDFVCEIVQAALDLFGLQSSQSYHLFGWSQHHDTSLPENVPN